MKSDESRPKSITQIHITEFVWDLSQVKLFYSLIFVLMQCSIIKMLTTEKTHINKVTCQEAK